MMAILGLLYLVVPVLVIIALVRISRLEKQLREGQARDAAQQKWLKDRLEALDRRVAGAAGSSVPPEQPSTAQPSVGPPPML